MYWVWNGLFIIIFYVCICFSQRNIISTKQLLFIQNVFVQEAIYSTNLFKILVFMLFFTKRQYNMIDVHLQYMHQYNNLRDKNAIFS